MLKLDSEIHKIQLPILTGSQVITYRSISKTETEVILMTPITEDEEQQLDSGFFHYINGNLDIVVDSKCKPIYGKIDFHTDSDDWYVLETMDWLNHLCGMGVSVPSNYDYEEHCCYSNNKKVMTYDTTNPAIVAQYKHALLGKPERVCIFRYKINGYKRIYNNS